jgi:hypothetical protein
MARIRRRMMYALMMSQPSHKKACTAEYCLQRLARDAVGDKSAGQIFNLTESLKDMVLTFPDAAVSCE